MHQGRSNDAAKWFEEDCYNLNGVIAAWKQKKCRGRDAGTVNKWI
jgi:hypothetical protein